MTGRIVFSKLVVLTSLDRQISTLAAAGLGNLVSDVAGLGLSNTIDAMSEKLGIPSPKLSAEQLAQKPARRVMSIASIVGISLGCLLGMVPLLFMDRGEDEEIKALFQVCPLK